MPRYFTILDINHGIGTANDAIFSNFSPRIFSRNVAFRILDYYVYSQFSLLIQTKNILVP